MKAKIGTYLGLIIVTGLALTVAITVMVSGRGGSAANEGNKIKGLVPPTPVSVIEARLESIEIADSYSGMIRPWERYSLGFEIAGRVIESLDEGHRVAAKQTTLARLDDRVFRARVKEAEAQLEAAQARLKDANAQLEKAQSDMNRSEKLRQSGGRAITEAEYQNYVTQLLLAEAQLGVAKAQVTMAAAQLETAEKNLDDTTLVSRVDGVVSKRMVNLWESVTAHQPVLEIIEVDEVLLVVGVPEAYVGEIRVGQEAEVELLARDRFRRKRPASSGRVHQVAEAADQTTGLFEVEIALPNPDGRWKPGQIALAKIVIDQIQGYRVPMTSTVFRDDKMLLFTVDEQHKAHCFDLKKNWIEQGSDLVVFNPQDWAEREPHPSAGRVPRPADRKPVSDFSRQHLEPSQQRLSVVTRGQHRLVAGRDVKLVQLGDDKPLEIDSRPLVRAPAPVVGAKPKSGVGD